MRLIDPYKRKIKGWTKSTIRSFAHMHTKNPTNAEKHFEEFLLSLNDGALKGKFKTQHTMSGKWILDFFFPNIRLGVEIDSGYHNTKRQKAKDLEKEADCQRFDITLLRLTNDEVFSDKSILTEKLRNAWRQALSRENKIIGKPYNGAKPLNKTRSIF